MIVTGIGIDIGVVLRSLRTGGRAEAWAMLISGVWFGMMHFTNVFLGSTVAIVALQVCMASLSGTTLYFFRRASGSIVPAMVAQSARSLDGDESDARRFLPAPPRS